MPFEKGQSGNPAGKKPGTLNKATVNNLKLNTWMDRLAEDVQLLPDAKERIQVSMQIIDRILAKSGIPSTPEESVDNVDRMIEAYENQKVNVNP